MSLLSSISRASSSSGFSGYSGVGGPGPSGFSGYSGTGQSGYSGQSGWSGYSGAVGTSGFSGWSGYSGPSGWSGYSGTSGVAGVGAQGRTYYFNSTANETINKYETFTTAPSSGTTDTGTASATSSSGEVLCVMTSSGRSGFCTNQGDPGITAIPVGTLTWKVRLHVSDNTATNTFVFRIYKVLNVSPYTETELFSFETEDINATTQTQYTFENYITEPVPLDPTDLVLTKIYFKTTSATSVTGTFTHDGSTTQSYVITPISAGVSGISGYSGQSGWSGYSGQSGWSGYSGAVGTSGFSGWSGYSGQSGWSGYSGAVGTSGFSGWSGYSGQSGWSGYSGQSGWSGYSGVSGWSGYSGQSGWSGYSGQSGWSGYSGVSGWSGYSGSGWSGYSGSSGLSGWSGYSGAAPTSITVSTGLANQTGQGIIVSLTYGESIVPGDLLYIKSDGAVWKADANAAGLYPVNALALETASSGSHTVLLHGLYRDDTRYNFTPGAEVYLSATAGAETTTQPSAAGDVIQVVGTAISADIIYFSPSSDYITHV